MRDFKLVTVILAGIVATAAPAAAQVDPLLFMKLQGTNAVNVGAPNVLLVVDTANRMQRDAPSDPTSTSTSRTTSTYYDPWYYPLDVTKTWQTTTLSVNATNTTQFFRRKYVGLDYANGSDKYSGSTIGVVRDRDSGYLKFEAATRLSIARAAAYPPSSAKGWWRTSVLPTPFALRWPISPTPRVRMRACASSWAARISAWKVPRFRLWPSPTCIEAGEWTSSG